MIPVEGDAMKTISTCNLRYSSKGQELDSKGCAVNVLLMYVQAEAATQVVDHSGLSGMYAYHLAWSGPSTSQTNAQERYPSFEDAMREQLGLEMKKTWAPVTLWMVDHAERPTEN